MYRIDSCKLTGFKRMLLNDIREITITPHSPVQIILGTNGCGKSSYLDQLTPLPADKDAYEKGGGKVINIFSNGSHFKCTSHRTGKMEHSFEMDGVELNPGGIEKVQRELCLKHFGVSQQTHDLQLGTDRFTEMNPAQRREWLTRMCDTDYSFAMASFEALKKKANALAGAVSENRKNLVSETAKIMNEAEQLKLETEVKELLNDLGILNAERAPLENPSAYHLDERTRALKALDEVSIRLLRNRVVVPLEYADKRVERDEWGELKRVYFGSIAEIDSEIDRLKHIATTNQALLTATHSQYEVLQRQHAILIKTGSEGVDSLNRQIGELRDEITKKVSALRLGLVFQDARAAQSAFDSIDGPLGLAIGHLPINADRRFGRQRHQDLQAQAMAIADRLRYLGEEIQRLVARRDHADEHRGKDQHTCPSCDHTWTVGVNETEYAQLLEDIKAKQIAIREPLAVQKKIQEDLTEIEGYFDQYREVMSYTKSLTILKPFWDYLQESQTLFEAPMEAVNLLRYVKLDLAKSAEIGEMERKIVDFEKLKLAAAEVGDTNLIAVQEQMEHITVQLGDLTSSLARVQRSVTDYSEYRRQLNTGLQLGEEVKRLKHLADTQQWEHIEAIRRESIYHCINQVTNALTMKEESLRAAKAQKQLVASLTGMLATYEIKEQAAKTMVKALSPTHGLIAEGLLGYIRNFVGQMNQFIDRIWTYPLQVIPTGYSVVDNEQSSELDYRFKLIVEREDNVVPDIGKGSKGQKEMINLAFKMTALRAMDLTDTPLFLDEFGEGLDETHSFRATEEIRWLMENGNFPQLFMISHFIAVHGSFTNAELCVLDDRNIALPAGRPYNQQVSITH